MPRFDYTLEERWLAHRAKQAELDAEYAALVELSQDASNLGITINAVKLGKPHMAWDAQANQALAMMNNIQIPLKEPTLDTTKGTLGPLLLAKGLTPVEKLIQGSCTQNLEFNEGKLWAMKQGNETLDTIMKKTTKRPIKE